MSQTLEAVFEKIKSLEADLDELRITYRGLNNRYVAVISKLGELILGSSEAAKRSAQAAEQARVAAFNAFLVEKEVAASFNCPDIIRVIAEVAAAASLAAVESAAASASSAAAAAQAVGHQADQSLLKACAEAVSASRVAAEAAAEAVKLSNQARASVDIACMPINVCTLDTELKVMTAESS